MPLVSSPLTVPYEHSESGLNDYVDDDMDGTVDSEENPNTSRNISIGVGRKRDSASCIQSTSKRLITAVTSLPCLEPGRRVNDECLNCLTDLFIRDHQQAFAAVDSLTLQAHAQSTSAVGSKAPRQFLTECTKTEHLLLPFYHICTQHWTLFVYNKSQTLLVHYDSMSDSIAQKALAQVYSFLTWLYRVESLDYQIKTRRVSSPLLSTYLSG